MQRHLSTVSSAPSTSLRVATWNVQSCLRGLPGVVGALRELHADVVALQEVDRGTSRSGGLDQAAVLAHECGFAHVRFFEALQYAGGEYGLAILSRHPLREATSEMLPNQPGIEPRIVASAIVEAPTGRLTVHATHFTNVDSWARLRKAQAGRVLDRIARSSTPALLMGDFNSLPGSVPHRLLRRELVDVFGAVGRGRGGTFPLPSILPDVRIDYLFATRDLLLDAAVVARTRASDHHPLIAEIRLPEVAAELAG